jgi:S1-C subfamily serine protease
MNWDDEETENEPTPQNGEVVVQHKARLSFLNALVAAALVLAVGGSGFVLGHDILKSSNATSTQSRVANPYLPSSGAGRFRGFGGFGGAFPSISGPSRRSTSAAQKAAAKIAKTVDPGLVDINTNLGYQDSAAAGTGMILTKNGYVLTNNHVIADATSITARDVATGKTYKATVVGYDVTNDVTVLKLSDAKNLTTVTLGDSNDVTKDEKVVGIGNAGGVGGTPSYSAGTVIALNQSITATDDASSSGSEHLTDLIEVNADIQPGDSGGPLVDSKGEVVGMDTAGSSNGSFGFAQSGSSSTQAYAIPIDTALSIAKSIEAGQGSSTIHVGTTAFLGVEVSDAGSTTSGGTSSTASGVTVQEVIPNTPAASTGLVAGDVITAINGTSVTTTTGLAEVIQTLHAGQSIQVSYVDQNGTQSSLTLTLGSGPAQ